MDALLVLFVSALVGYSVACGTVGAESDAPLWLSWPLPIWNAIAHDWRRPTPVPARPDYAKIERLERELGIGDHPLPELSPFEQGLRRGMQERPMRHGNLCLTKDCMGDTTDVRTYAGVLVRRIHTCERQ